MPGSRHPVVPDLAAPNNMAAHSACGRCGTHWGYQNPASVTTCASGHGCGTCPGLPAVVRLKAELTSPTWEKAWGKFPTRLGRLVADPADLAAQHRVLVAEYQELGVLGHLMPGPQDPARVRDPPQPAPASPVTGRRRPAETATPTDRSRAVPRTKTGSGRWPNQRISPGRVTWMRFSAPTAVHSQLSR